MIPSLFYLDCYKETVKIDKFVPCRLGIDYGRDTSVFLELYRSIVTLGLSINDNRIYCRRCAEEPGDEGTLLVRLMDSYCHETYCRNYFELLPLRPPPLNASATISLYS